MKFSGKRIFIIEDNSVNRTVMEALFEARGAEIASEVWGRDFLEKMLAFAPVDLVLLDLMFPANISGYDIYDQIRQLREFEKTPIVAVSAAEPDINIPRAYRHGFAGFISKPIVDYELFVEQIETVLHGEEVWYGGL